MTNRKKRFKIKMLLGVVGYTIQGKNLFDKGISFNIGILYSKRRRDPGGTFPQGNGIKDIMNGD